MKTVLITGASSGIGRALALEFAARGYHLGLAARRLDLLLQLRDEVQAMHPAPARRIEIVALDVDQPDAVASTLRPLFEALGKVDIVVVNAGVNRLTPVGRGKLVEQVIDHDLGTHESKPIWMDGKWGVVGKPYRNYHRQPDSIEPRSAEVDSIYLLLPD